MLGERDPRLAPDSIRARYNDPKAFAAVDEWHRYTASEIRRHVNRWWNRTANGDRGRVLNAGAGGNDLGVCPNTTINVDLSERRLSPFSTAVVASIEAMPIATGSIDIALCVGSVINYCDAAAAISELSRVLRPDGHLIVEFESSRSAELALQKSFGDSVGVVKTFYCKRTEVVWAYRLDYVKHLLSATGFVVTEIIPIHVLSPWVLLVLRSKWAAALVARLDRFGRDLPLMTRWASNFLLFCEKRS